MKESQIVNMILGFLNRQGVYAIRINSGQVMSDHGTLFRGAPCGTSDIIGFIKGEGRFVAIEVKTPKTKNRVTQYQKDFLSNVKEEGGVAVIAWDIESLEAAFKEYGYKFN